jgi:hypothetical protein
MTNRAGKIALWAPHDGHERSCRVGPLLCILPKEAVCVKLCKWAR